MIVWVLKGQMIGPDVQNKFTLILLNKNPKIYESIILIGVNLMILASSINFLDPELYFTMLNLNLLESFRCRLDMINYIIQNDYLHQLT